MIEREAPGGQAGMSSRIENYLGFPTGLSGGDLARRAVVQAERFGVEILSPQEATAVRAEGPYRIIKLADENEISCHALMIATGVQWRRLEAPGIDRLQGAGVYYGGGATEALSCKGEIVYVIGGANSAGQAAMNFAKFAERVVIVVRSASLSSTMSQYLIDQVKETPNIQIWPNASVSEAHGDTHLEEISFLCSDTDKTERVPASAMFIFMAHCRAQTGLPASSNAMIAASSSPAPILSAMASVPRAGALIAIPFCSKPMFPASSPSAMSVTVR